jgi:hypothetical protein
MGELLDGLTIVDAYSKWCGKSRVKAGNRTEGIKVSCPNPAHPDKDPSAWLNTQKGTWYCGGCDIGGDQYDIAAYHFNLPVPGYKEGKTFHDLRILMATSLGYRVVSAPGIEYLHREEEGQEAQTADVAGKEGADSLGEEERSVPSPGATDDQPSRADTASHPGLAQVIALHGDDDTDDDIPLGYLDWEPLVEPGTFLDTWMESTKIDDIPDEYYFWNGLLAIGMALGRDTSLYDRRPVYSNLYVCIVGPTGSGKSQSEGHLNSLLMKALPYDPNDPFSKGTHFIDAPASGESVVWSFRKDIVDPSTGKSVGLFPVRGLLTFNELSALTARAGRMGNTMKSTLMQMYDCPEFAATHSRTHGDTRARAPFASLLTTTQPKSMGRLLTSEDMDAGFINRFLFVSGKPKKRMAIGGTRIEVTGSINPIQAIRAWGGKHAVIDWSGVSAKTYTEYYHDFIEPAKKKSPTLSRLDLLAKKLVLLFTANEMEPEVQLSAIERMTKMMPYLLQCYGFTADQIGNDQAWEVREDILRHVKKHTAKGGMTLRVLNDRIKRKKFPTSLVRRTLDDLVHLQLLSAEATKGVGRPTVKYKAVED